MARISKVRITFPRAASSLVTFSRAVLQSVKTNPKFPDLNDPPPAEPDPSVPTWIQVKTAVDNLEVQEIKVLLGGTKAATSLRNDLQRVLDAPLTGMLVKWVNYVQEKSVTNETDMLSSGFAITKQPEKIDSLPQPEFLRVISYEKKILKFAVNVIDGARGYQWTLQKVDAEGQPISGIEPIRRFSTAAENRFTNLESGARYACTAYGVGSRDTVSTETDPLIVVCL